MTITCAFNKLVPPDELRPNDQNPNKHSKAQIDRLAKLIEYQGFRHPIIVSLLSGKVVAGHGRLAAAKKLGLKEVPVDYQDFPNPEAEYAFLVSDNAISEWSELDFGKINLALPELGPNFDLEMLGLENFGLDSFGSSGASGSGSYTKKIEAPKYEPKGDRPPVAALYDTMKLAELLREIEESSASEEEKTFLREAAHRHVVFDYQNIAEFYAHASKEVQNLMEKSALVIIDFDKAIELGFVALSDRLAEAYKTEASDDAAL